MRVGCSKHYCLCLLYLSYTFSKFNKEKVQFSIIIIICDALLLTDSITLHAIGQVLYHNVL